MSQKLCAEGSYPTLSCGWRQGRAWQIEMSRHSPKNSPSCPHCAWFYPSCKRKVAAPFSWLPLHFRKHSFPQVSTALKWRDPLDGGLRFRRRPSSLKFFYCLGDDCDSDHQLFIAKFRLKLKKIRKNNMPARYDLNQIPYEFTVEITNRFKGRDLVNSVPEEL